MKIIRKYGIALSGVCAGAINGLFGAGGGMILVPLLSVCDTIKEEEVFPSSVTIILPICLVSLSLSLNIREFDWVSPLPYFIGSAIGGILCGIFGKKIPTLWLHRILGILILWGGVRYLC